MAGGDIGLSFAELERRLADLPPKRARMGARIVSFLRDSPAEALASSAAEIAARMGSSDATIIRTVQALGFDGMPGLRRALVASLGASTPADDLRRTLDQTGPESAAAVELVLRIHAENIEEHRKRKGREKLGEAVAALSTASRVMTFGVGPSAPLAHYVAALLNRHGRAAGVLDRTGLGLADQLLGLATGDALLLLAYGVPYRESIATAAEGKRLGLPIVLVTDTPDSRLAKSADVVVRARRGRAGGVALHAATLALLEAIVIGLAAHGRNDSLRALERLNQLRAGVADFDGKSGRERPSPATEPAIES